MAIILITNRKIDFELAERRLKANPAIERIRKCKTIWVIQTVPLWIKGVNLGKFEIRIEFSKSSLGANNFTNPRIKPLFCKKPVITKAKSVGEKYGTSVVRYHILTPSTRIIKPYLICTGSYCNYLYDANRNGDLAKSFFWAIAALLAEDDKESYISIEEQENFLNGYIHPGLSVKEEEICFGKANQIKMDYNGFMKTMVQDNLKFKNNLEGNASKFIGNYHYRGERDEDENDGYCDDCGEYDGELEDGLCDYCREKRNCTGCGSYEHPDNMHFCNYNDEPYCESCWNESIACSLCERRLFKSDSRFAKDGKVFCEDCWNENFSTCEICEEAFRNEELNEDGLCESCFYKELEKEVDGRKRKRKFKSSIEKKPGIYKSATTSA